MLSWQEVAKHFRSSWEKIILTVEYVVSWGLKHWDLSDITTIGVDGIARCKGHNYLTVVYQIDRSCVFLQRGSSYVPSAVPDAPLQATDQSCRLRRWPPRASAVPAQRRGPCSGNTLPVVLHSKPQSRSLSKTCSPPFQFFGFFGSVGTATPKLRNWLRQSYRLGSETLVLRLTWATDMIS